jgi:hypothetical protein
VTMLAPHGEEYTIKNLFQGYVDREVLDQVPYELSKADVRGDESDVGVMLERVELTESGGGIEYFTVFSEGERGQSVGLQLMRSRFRDRRGQQQFPRRGDKRRGPGKSRRERLARTDIRNRGRRR